MAGRSQPRRSNRLRGLILSAALQLASLSSVAQAQVCTAPLSDSTESTAAAASDKFRLIAQQCQALAEPVKVRRAAQLDLYDGSASVAVTMSATQPQSEDAPPAPLIMLNGAATPLSRDAARVISLTPSVTAAALASGIDPLLLHAIAHVESRHNATAVSRAGARGVMQMMPATARRFGVGDEQSLFDADTNLRASAAYLRTLQSRYGDDLRLVLAAYNAGEGAVDRNGGHIPPYPETQAYVRDVLAVYRRLTSTFAVSASGTLIARGDKQ